MKRSPQFSSREMASPIVLLTIAMATIFLFLFGRSHGVFATIMWDEWEYNRFSRQLPLSTADVPSYLYYFVYGATKACGDNFLSCAQGLNALFFAASIPLIYSVAQKLVSRGWALAVAVSSVVGGISVYSAHFMPEAFYFFGFWLGIVLLLATLSRPMPSYVLGGLSGTYLALLSLVKLHALFLVPGLALYFSLAAYFGLYSKQIRPTVISVAMLFGCFGAIRLGLGFAIAGATGLSFFGQLYGARAENSVASAANFVPMMVNAFDYFVGHALALASLFGLPLLLTFFIDTNTTTLKERHSLALKLLTLSFLLPLLVVVSFYTSRLSLLDPVVEGAEGLLRLHMRYYDFLFPLLIITTTAVATGRAREVSSKQFRLSGALIVTAISALFVSNLKHIELSVADGPELRGFATVAVLADLLLVLGMVATITWVTDARKAARFYLLLFYPIFTLAGCACATYSAFKEMTPNSYHQAGLFAHRRLGADTAKLAIIGPEFPGVYQAMFYADNPSIVPYSNISQKNCALFTPTPGGSEWFLLIGTYPEPSDNLAVIKTDGFTLVQREPSVVSFEPCPSPPQGMVP